VKKLKNERRQWIPEDDVKLLEAVKVYKKNWKSIEQNVQFSVPRKSRQINSHWEKLAGKRKGTKNDWKYLILLFKIFRL